MNSLTRPLHEPRFTAAQLDASARGTTKRVDALDATRAFALILGVIFHASLSFSPYFMGWAVQDVSTSAFVADFIQISHSFRMETFFLLAGFLSHGLYHRKGAGAFIRSRAIRLGVPFVFGWFLLKPLVISGWVMGSASMRGDYDFWAAIRAGFASLQTLPQGLFTRTHLWFLYYLLLITAFMLVGRGIAARVLGQTRAEHPGLLRAPRLDAAVAWFADSPWALVVLIPPTAVALWFMTYWGMDTPDQTLRPHWPVLVVYGGFFSLGWLFARRPGLILRFGRLTVFRAALALGSGYAVLKLGAIQADPGHPNYFGAHVGFTLCYATLMWTLVALTLGVLQKLMDRPRPLIRYLADSSYWMYLLHLPIVVWLQVAVAEVNVHWAGKLAFVSLATIALSLVTYDLFVRATWVGVLLNGRRQERVVFRALRSHDRGASA